MAVELPVVETGAPGILIVRYEWAHLLEPELQEQLVAQSMEAAARGPAGLVFVLADRICEISPAVRIYWRKVLCQRASRVAAMGVVTSSWAVQVETMAFAVTLDWLGVATRVATFTEEQEGIAWATSAVEAAQRCIAPPETVVPCATAIGLPRTLRVHESLQPQVRAGRR